MIGLILIISMISSPASPDAQVQPILKQQEADTNAKIPSVLAQAAPTESPTSLFSDFVNTGNQMFKQASGYALSKLHEFANDAQDAVTSMPVLGGGTTYQRPALVNSVLPKTIPAPIQSSIFKAASSNVSAPVLSQILNAENKPANPLATRFNKNGSTDYGLFQINSSMLPFVRNQFKAEGSIFNPLNADDSARGARMILEDNASKFQTSVGRAPTDKELIASYHIGLPETIKAAKDDIAAQKKEQSYDKLAQS